MNESSVLVCSNCNEILFGDQAHICPVTFNVESDTFMKTDPDIIERLKRIEERLIRLEEFLVI